MSSSTTQCIPISSSNRTPSSRAGSTAVAEGENGFNYASSNLSSSFPGAIKTIQLYQLQKRHSNLVEDKDSSEMFINCNVECTSPAAPWSEHHRPEKVEDAAPPPSPKLSSPPKPKPPDLTNHDKMPFAGTARPGRQLVRSGVVGSLVELGEKEAAACESTVGTEKGIVKWYSGRKNYGFITNLDDQTDYFVHREDLKPKKCHTPVLYTGEYVEYTTSTSEDGRPKACNVRGINEGPLLCDHGSRPHVKVVETTMCYGL